MPRSATGANMSEIVRAAISSIPTGRCESAVSIYPHPDLAAEYPAALGATDDPARLNWFGMLTMSSPMVSILGVNDGMTLTQNALAPEGRSKFPIPMYPQPMIRFFFHHYPSTVRTRRPMIRFAGNAAGAGYLPPDADRYARERRARGPRPCRQSNVTGPWPTPDLSPTTEPLP